MKRLAHLGAIAALLAAPAAASDFSALGKPEFARGLLLPLERRQEIVCMQRWHLARRTDLEPVSTEIRRRLAIELGTTAYVADSVDRMTTLIDGVDVQGRPESLPSSGQTGDRRCDQIAANLAQRGPTAAFALLAPRASGPIALPSTGFCLAQLEQGKIAKDDPELTKTSRDLRAQADKSQLLSADERAAIERDYAAFSSTTPPIANWGAIRGTELADLICFPTLSNLSKQLRGER